MSLFTKIKAFASKVFNWFCVSLLLLWVLLQWAEGPLPLIVNTVGVLALVVVMLGVALNRRANWQQRQFKEEEMLDLESGHSAGTQAWRAYIKLS